MKTGFWIFFAYIFGCILAFALAFRKAMDKGDDWKDVYVALIVGLCCTPFSWLYVVAHIINEIKKKKQ